MLIERESALRRLDDLAAQARAGSGRLLFLGAEAGIGKSALVHEFTAQLVGFERRVGTVDNITTADAFAPISEAFPDLALTGNRVEIYRAVRGRLAEHPTLLVLEDLHWADGATLDTLRYLGRRLGDLSCLVIVTFRADEVTSDHPLAVVMGELATSAGVERMELQALSRDGVARLAEQAGATVDVDLLFARTNGNAFYVSETLAASSQGVAPTISDAVHARLAPLSAGARRVVDALAILGSVDDLGLLLEVAGQDGPALDECVAQGAIVVRDGLISFRHEIAREAVESSLSPAAGRLLHQAAYACLEGRNPDDHRRLAHHARGAGDTAATIEHALLAGRRAALLSAHHEAAQQFEVVLDLLRPDAPERPAMLEELGYQYYLTDENAAAMGAHEQALTTYRARGDHLRVGDNLRRLNRLAWLLGRNAESERYLEEAVAILEPLGPTRELATAYSAWAQMCMLKSDVPGAELWGGRALELARSLGDTDTEIHALNNLGTALLETTRWEEGEPMLRESLRLALQADAEEHAARAYTNLGSTAAAAGRLDLARAILTEGLAYCDKRNLSTWSRYKAGWLAMILTEQGDWEEGDRLSQELLASPHLSAVSEIQGLVAAGLIRVRRGDDEGREYLTRAHALSLGTGEIQRVALVAGALCELAWLDGDIAAVEEFAAEARELAQPELINRGLDASEWWRRAAGLPPARVPRGPFVPMGEGDWVTAAEQWQREGSPFWRAQALAMSPEVAHGDEAVRLLDGLGAARSAEAVRRMRHERGLAVPRRPRSSTLDNPGGLTARELEVLRLVANGHTDAEIAAALVISPKTAGHHVSALLRKLGVKSRSAAAVTARERSLV